jgi:hypothetical protein
MSVTWTDRPETEILDWLLVCPDDRCDAGDITIGAQDDAALVEVHSDGPWGLRAFGKNLRDALENAYEQRVQQIARWKQAGKPIDGPPPDPNRPPI